MEGRWREAEHRARESEGRSAQMEETLREEERRWTKVEGQSRAELSEVAVRRREERIFNTEGLEPSKKESALAKSPPTLVTTSAVSQKPFLCPPIPPPSPSSPDPFSSGNLELFLSFCRARCNHNSSSSNHSSLIFLCDHECKPRPLHASGSHPLATPVEKCLLRD